MELISKPYLRTKIETLDKWAWKGKVLVITGARQVGKSTLIHQWLSKQNTIPAIYNVDDPEVMEMFEKFTLTRLKKIVGKSKIVVIDEVQRIQNAGLLLKLLADNFKEVQFIASGSSSLEISEKIFEPLTGRHYNFHLYPMALNEIYKGKTPFEIKQQLPFHLVYGMYPAICRFKEDAEMNLKNLASQYLYKDVLVWKDIRKPELLEKLLKLLAYQVGSEISVHELANKLKVKSETVENYIDLLEKSFVVYRLNCYSSNNRSEVTKMKKLFFYDNGIRNAVIGDFEAAETRTDIGKLWENFMVMERIKVNDNRINNDCRNYFWRNLNQSEVDLVETEKKKIRAFEMKWGTFKKNYVTKSFTALYPKAETQVVTPEDFEEFCRV